MLKCFLTDFGSKRAVVPLSHVISTQSVSAGCKSSVALIEDGNLKLWWNEPM